MTPASERRVFRVLAQSEMTVGTISAKTGVIPTRVIKDRLVELEQFGYVESRKVGSHRRYQLTDRGRKLLNNSRS